VKRNLCLLSLAIIFLLAINSNGQSNNRSQLLLSSPTFSISLQAVSWKAYDFDCSTGDTLSGSFILTRDGDLFPGDQTKYDNWLLGGIDFLIMNETTFDTWKQGIPIFAQYERNSITELSWSFEILSTGKWYVIYVNHSIYIKQIEMSISHTSPSNPTISVIVISLAIILIPLSLHYVNKKK
jgi:hypothetical protein